MVLFLCFCWGTAEAVGDEVGERERTEAAVALDSSTIFIQNSIVRLDDEDDDDDEEAIDSFSVFLMPETGMVRRSTRRHWKFLCKRKRIAKRRRREQPG